MARITTYAPLPIAFTHGQGMWLYDDKEQAYLDSYSGIGVCALGHAHPEIAHAINEQANKLIHTSNGFIIPEQTQLADKICTMSHMQQAFFCNSGGEANEAAIKLARLYGHKKQIETPSIIVMEKAFHGRTMGTLSASGNRRIQAGFEPFLPGFIRAPYNDIAAIYTIAANRDDVVGVLLEPIQGEGGINVAEETYLRALAQFCDKQDWLLMFDEVQTGIGRTGKFFAHMDLGIEPDVIATAKALGNGLPIGATLMNHRAYDLFNVGNHGSTFGGNQLACRIAHTVLSIIERDNLCGQIAHNGIIFKEKLNTAFSDLPYVRAIRGKGYMLGIELDRPAQALKTIALEHHLLINITADRVIRLLPAYIMQEKEMDILIERLGHSLEQFTHKFATF